VGTAYPYFQASVYAWRPNYPKTQATDLARAVRECYLNQERWSLYDDVVGALSSLSKSEYRHVILSNHVPELSQLLAGLGIAPFFERVFNSSVTGIEKPNPAAFLNVTRAYPEVSHFVMIGDRLMADISGAESVGMSAVLVRNAGGKTKHKCASLLELVDYPNLCHLE
jgi:HAD superfamily hydrolase (TIGR01549 family)